jgi:hypothetical protein
MVNTKDVKHTLTAQQIVNEQVHQESTCVSFLSTLKLENHVSILKSYMEPLILGKPTSSAAKCPVLDIYFATFSPTPSHKEQHMLRYART